MLVAAERRAAVCCSEKRRLVGRERRNVRGDIPLGCAAETGRRATVNCSGSWLVQLRVVCCLSSCYFLHAFFLMGL